MKAPSVNFPVPLVLFFFFVRGNALPFPVLGRRMDSAASRCITVLLIASSAESPPFAPPLSLTFNTPTTLHEIKLPKTNLRRSFAFLFPPLEAGLNASRPPPFFSERGSVAHFPKICQSRCSNYPDPPFSINVHESVYPPMRFKRAVFPLEAIPVPSSLSLKRVGISSLLMTSALQVRPWCVLFLP